MTKQNLSHTIGWYGLGTLGLELSLNLQTHLSTIGSRHLRYSNPTMSRGARLCELGAVPRATWRELVLECDVVFILVSSDAKLKSLMHEACRYTGLKGKIFVDFSAVYPDTSQSASRKLATHGAAFIGASFFGGVACAGEGKLLFALAGPQSNVEKVKALVVGSMSMDVVELGSDVRRVGLARILGNIVKLGIPEVIREVKFLAEKSGVGLDEMDDIIKMILDPTLDDFARWRPSGVWAPPLPGHPGFALTLAIKDVDHAIALAKSAGVEAVALHAARNYLVTTQKTREMLHNDNELYDVSRNLEGLVISSAEASVM